MRRKEKRPKKDEKKDTSEVTTKTGGGGGGDKNKQSPSDSSRDAKRPTAEAVGGKKRKADQPTMEAQVTPKIQKFESVFYSDDESRVGVLKVQLVFQNCSGRHGLICFLGTMDFWFSNPPVQGDMDSPEPAKSPEKIQKLATLPSFALSDGSTGTPAPSSRVTSGSEVP